MARLYHENQIIAVRGETFSAIIETVNFSGLYPTHKKKGHFHMDEIRYYMNETLISIDSESNALEAARRMLEQQVKSLLVDEKGKYVGLVTPSDITFKVTAEGRAPDTVKVSQIMAKPLITLESDLTMARAFLHMHKNHVRHIVVTEEKKIVGVISMNDFVAYYANKLSQKKEAEKK